MMMLQMVRLGDQYFNLAHVLGVRFDVHRWEDDEGAHEVTVAVVEMATTCGGVAGEGHAPVTYRFYGQTARVLRHWLDERTTVIAEEAEACPEPVWALGTQAAWGEWDEEGDEDDLNAEADEAAAERAAALPAGAPAWTWEGPAIPFHHEEKHDEWRLHF